MKQKQLTNFFPSAFFTTLLRTPLNYLNGVMLLCIPFSTVLYRYKVAFADTPIYASKITLRLPTPPLYYRQVS